MVANLEKRYTLEEYFELERNTDERYEFFNGEVFCMSGGSSAHERICRDTLIHLSSLVTGRKCEAFTSNMRIKVPSHPPYRYADVSALCGEAKFEKIGGVDALVNPALIVEVLSDSTANYDRSEKFRYYKSIESFSEYLLVAQDGAAVTQLFRTEDGEWIYRDFADLGAVVHLPSLDCDLSLREIYRNVTFPPPIVPPLERDEIR
ncbi:MAG: Uma2 family endonuclease [Pyrinomonadaceae bacterium MAG19_C2-C3]|nr:Uma2 family endonuclease [Pyrinomonadaceae bacterium MAG19_C2-C3]